MELAKIRNLSDEELGHQEKTSAEQLFRLRFQVAMGQNDGVKKLRQLQQGDCADQDRGARARAGHSRRDQGREARRKPSRGARGGSRRPEGRSPKPSPRRRKAAKKAAPDAETKTEKAKGARK